MTEDPKRDRDPADVHVAVIMGGWSAERAVSLVTGKAFAEACRAIGYRTSEIDAGHDLSTVLTETKPDVVLNALHGPWGEDGCVQGILECLQIPYTHSGVLASALAMDKQRAKYLFREKGIPVADSLVADAGDDTADLLHDKVAGTAFRPPVFLAVGKRVAHGIHLVSVRDRHHVAGRGFMLHVIDSGPNIDDGLEHRVRRDVVHPVPVHIDFTGATDAVAILVSTTDHGPVLTCHP